MKKHVFLVVLTKALMSCSKENHLVIEEISDTSTDAVESSYYYGDSSEDTRRSCSRNPLLIRQKYDECSHHEKSDHASNSNGYENPVEDQKELIYYDNENTEQ